jgi:hypothetical protein
MDVQVYKDALLKKRSEILGAGGIKPLQASMENNTRQGDGGSGERQQRSPFACSSRPTRKSCGRSRRRSGGLNTAPTAFAAIAASRSPMPG